MNRRSMMGALVALAVFGPVSRAQAADPVQTVVAQLRAEGFGQIDAQRTFLGRVRITASRKGQAREIVLDPRSGEVLRDLTRKVSGGSSGGSGSGGSGNSGSGNSGSGNSGSGNSGSDDDSDDDRNDDSGSDDDSDKGDDNDRDSDSDSGKGGGKGGGGNSGKGGGGSDDDDD